MNDFRNAHVITSSTDNYRIVGLIYKTDKTGDWDKRYPWITEVFFVGMDSSFSEYENFRTLDAAKEFVTKVIQRGSP